MPFLPSKEVNLKDRNLDTDTLYTRWTLAAMRKDLQRDLPSPDEDCARHHCLRERMEAPDLATVKDFFRYYISLSHGKIVDKLTVDLVKINASTPCLGFAEPLVHDFPQDQSARQVPAGSPQTAANSLLDSLWQVFLLLGCSHALLREKGLGGAWQQHRHL